MTNSWHLYFARSPINCVSVVKLSQAHQFQEGWEYSWYLTDKVKNILITFSIKKILPWVQQNIFLLKIFASYSLLPAEVLSWSIRIKVEENNKFWVLFLGHLIHLTGQRVAFSPIILIHYGVDAEIIKNGAVSDAQIIHLSFKKAIGGYQDRIILRLCQRKTWMFFCWKSGSAVPEIKPEAGVLAVKIFKTL